MSRFGKGHCFTSMMVACPPSSNMFRFSFVFIVQRKRCITLVAQLIVVHFKKSAKHISQLPSNDIYLKMPICMQLTSTTRISVSRQVLKL